jgi:hypothetical protein
MYPIDTVKTHVQACGSTTQGSLLHTCKLLYNEGGFLRFWKGAQAIVTGCLPADAAYFTVYEMMRRHLRYNNDDFDIVKTATIGAAATLAHDFLITPSDSNHLSYLYEAEVYSD